VTAPRGVAVAIREARDEDVATIRSILAEHGNDGPVVTADIVGPYLRHLIEHGRARVAEEDGLVVAFGATVDAGRVRHLADLFVRRDRLGQGLGRPLLAAVFGDAEQRTTFASDDPRALPIYVRAGMQPWWASLYVEGTSDGLEAGAALVPQPAGPDELARAERAMTGIDRTTDARFWATQAEADGFLVRDERRVVGVGWARVRQGAPVRVLDRLVVAPDAAVDPVAVTIAALARAGRGGPVMTALQGPSPALRPLLERGFVIVDRDQFMASGPGLIDPTRFIPNPGML
jgi:GNAT superfamily N-acetyltransferase